MDDSSQIMKIINERQLISGKNQRANVYSDEYRHDLDNDSSTDEEIETDENSSDDEEDCTSKIGNVITKTSKTGKVRVRVAKESDEDENDMDDFEADMEKELSSRLLEAEKNAAIARTVQQSFNELENNQEEPMDEIETSKQDEPNSVDGKYSDVYFDSDEEESDNRKLLSNDDLFYDPDKDDDDQLWVDSVRKSYSQPNTSSKNPGKLPNSDAVLNCPACFTVLCLDCQRHEIYKTQYRAMFVVNCTVKTDEKLKFPVKGKAKKGKSKKEKVIIDPNCDYHPVSCDNCKTEVAMYDQDEVYHFFNVVASHN